MRITNQLQRRVCVLLAFGAACSIIPASVSSAIEPQASGSNGLNALEVAAVGDTAAKLLGTYSDPDRDTYLRNRYLMQLEIGRYADADETIGELMDLRRRAHPDLVPRLYGWRLFARAKRIAASNGGDDQAAIKEAFGQLVSELSDKEAVEVFPYFDVSLDDSRRDLRTAVDACQKVSLISCETKFAVILNYSFVEAWNYLLPSAGALKIADENKRFVIERNVMVPTADGAKVEAMLVRPRSGTPRKVALLEFTIYADDDTSFARASKMAAYGYAGVEAYSRGKGLSPGAAVPFEYDGRDAKTVIDWIARQGWSDGRVGMFSSSYNGFTQWAAAKERPKALKAIATSASEAPGIDTPMEGNIFQSFVYPWTFYVTDNKYLDESVYNDSARWKALNRKWYLSGRPYRDLEKIDGTPNPIFDKWLKHPSYDSYWKHMIPYGREFSRIDIPVLATTGYFDGAEPGVLYYFREHARHDPKADHRLLIGPYIHIQMQIGAAARAGDYNYDPSAIMDLQDIRLQWFDHVFHGTPLPALLSQPVNFEVMGGNIWRHVNSLEAMGDKRIRLYLGARQAADQFTLDPRPFSSFHSARLQVDLTNRSDVDFQRPDVPISSTIDTRNSLVFESEPFDASTEIDGPFSAHLLVAANKRDFDLSVVLYEHMKDGRYFQLASFIGRASYIAHRSRRELLVPGRKRLLAFESDRLTARSMAAGSRVVAVVGIVKRPDAQINYGTGKDVSSESIADAGDPLSIEFLPTSYIELQIRKLRKSQASHG